MRTRLIVAGSLAAALMTCCLQISRRALQTKRSAAPRESRIAVGKAALYSRDIGRGQPIIVLHGGPDDCGHFAYLECAGDVRNAFNDFLRRARATAPSVRN
jgi:hypothetical protein